MLTDTAILCVRCKTMHNIVAIKFKSFCQILLIICSITEDGHQTGQIYIHSPKHKANQRPLGPAPDVRFEQRPVPPSPDE